MRLQSGPGSKTRKTIDVAQCLYRFHMDTVNDSVKRVNFQRAFIKLLQDINSVLLYNKVRRPEFFEHRLDPANCCNLLHFFSFGAGGELQFLPKGSIVPHVDEIFLRHPANLRHINDSFMELRAGLRAFVQNKNTYAAEENRLPLSCLDTINRKGTEDFSFVSPDTKRTFFVKARGALRRYGKRVLGR